MGDRYMNTIKFTTPDMPLRKTVRFFSDQGLRNRKPEAQISSRESGTGPVQRIAYKRYRLGAMGRTQWSKFHEQLVFVWFYGRGTAKSSLISIRPSSSVLA